MSRTIRSDEFGNKKHDGMRREKLLKRSNRYVGFADEGIWNRKSKKKNKRMVTKHNRRADGDYELDF